ncbi:MAG: Mut7-C ubiquitin/RNAse domain-containing protein [Acidobacteriia bacterium]|nr:Mut7-C ubiquitin/RNAse domain-containing protein [Terriglobia bacterium]
MKQAYVRFYAELNDFLPPVRRRRATAYSFVVSGSVKDMIEALGVPHTEVDVILVNGESVDFSCRVQDGDRISVYPAFESIDVAPVIRLKRQPLGEKCFVLDTHLGRLAAYLRMLGFDTVYRNDCQDEELAQIASREGRILLTRDQGLLKRNLVTRGYCVRATLPREQVAEIVERFALARLIVPFQRCVHCNALLQPVRKELVLHRLLPETRQHFEEFYICPACERIYWKGSHYRRMSHLIETIRARSQRQQEDNHP